MQIFETPGNSAPARTVCRDVLTADGLSLRCAMCIPKDALGTVIIFQGRADFIERYFETMREIVSRGYAVVAFDWRGQGGSQRLLKDQRRGHARNFRHYFKDIDAIFEQAALGGCPEPYYGLAHSTGGLILLNHLVDKTPLTKVVMTSPLIDFRYGAWPVPVAHGLATLARFTGLGWLYLPGFNRGPLRRNEYDNNPLTSDRRRWDRDTGTLEVHPELGVGGPTFSWFRGAVKFIANLKAWQRRQIISCPVLFICAEQEKVVDPRAARHLSDRIAGISCIEIEDAKHEILMEKDAVRKQFWAAFDSFITS